MSRAMAVVLGLIVTQSMLQSVAGAQEMTERELQKLLRPLYYREGARYTFRLDNTQETILDFRDKPVMSWTGRQGRGFSSGDVFVWTHSGRAEVIGCIASLAGRNNTRVVIHEFHALTKNKMPGVRVGPDLWKPDRAGVDFRAIEGAPQPGNLARERLAQMRSLSREFHVRLNTASGTIESLRPLPQPIFRNSTEDGKLGDGALFAFVWDVGTDPEFLLLLETLQTDDGYYWHYAPVRFNHREIWLEHRDREVWNATRLAGRRGEPYVTLVVGNKTLRELQE